HGPSVTSPASLLDVVSPAGPWVAIHIGGSWLRLKRIPRLDGYVSTLEYWRAWTQAPGSRERTMESGPRSAPDCAAALRSLRGALPCQHVNRFRRAQWTPSSCVIQDDALELLTLGLAAPLTAAVRGAATDRRRAGRRAEGRLRNDGGLVEG